ncbi:MAG: glycosyltransferase [Oscillospiraceae bacterium]|jgi:glycosyltransferase involved in cell wall biosynthesis|nr:glycosyltransferase [Oscillospiraceae bacterium]
MHVYIWTHAYNAEKTLPRTIESVLGQTYRDFTYLLLDNGSTDSTGDVVREYAALDSRIVPFFNEKNWVGYGFYEAIRDNVIDRDCFFCTLDADDEYLPEFLEKCVDFMERFDCDIACASSQSVDAETGELLEGSNAVDYDMIIEGEKFSDEFFNYGPMLFTIWGKVYKSSVLRKFDYAYRKSMSYGSDTAFALEAFKHADCVGALSEKLHKYYISKKSTSFVFDVNRIYSIQKIVDLYCNYLRVKNGLTAENISHVYNAYANNINQVMVILENAELASEEKLAKLLQLIDHDHTRELMRQDYIDKPSKDFLIQNFQVFIYNLLDECSEAIAPTAVKICAFTGQAPERLPPWGGEALVSFALALLDAIGSAATPFVRRLLAKSSIIVSLNPGSLRFLREPISRVIDGDAAAALDSVLELLDEEIPDEFAEDFIELGSNLSAAAENPGAWLLFQKLRAQFFIEQSRFDEARALTEELAEMLPGDEEIEMLKRGLPQ